MRAISTRCDTANARYYVDGNVVEGKKGVTQDNGLLFDRTEFKGKTLVTRQFKPFAVPEVRTVAAAEAFKEVLEKVGAILPVRDAADRANCAGRDRHIIDSPEQVGGWPEYRGGTPPEDSDGDGMPDDWEIKHHLNPHDAADGNLIPDGDGYTNIEQYLNEPRL